MKNIFILLAFMIATVASQAQTVNVQSKINFPIGNADWQTASKADSGTINIVAVNAMTYVDRTNAVTAGDTLKSNITYTFTWPTGWNGVPVLKLGSRLFIEYKNGSKATPYTVNFGTGAVPLATAIAGAANKRQLVELLFNGSAFRVIGVKQID